jgi:3-dehydroquinate dehydratase-2
MNTSSAPKTLAVLNGPNLNLLGEREPEIYGSETLGEIEAMCRTHLQGTGFELFFAQTNSEGGLVDLVQQQRGAGGLVINAAGYTHTSVALLDALMTVEAPVIEVHLSSPARREPFRHKSIIAPACRGVIAGLGILGYRLALDASIALARAKEHKS